jgi:hypothetical protein
MDFVHLDDMFVMFRACLSHSRRIVQIKDIARECSATAGVQFNGASV